jgi:hypothetical protein
MHEIGQAMMEKIRVGLERRSLVSPSRYAENVRIMGTPFAGPWSFDRHPWLREMHDCKAEMMVGQKAAQMGYTECALNRVFHAIDYLRLDVMYVLPTKTPDAGDFSASRFDPALEESEKLRLLFTSTDNVGHKRAGSANLLVRGSKSRSQLKSQPINFLVLDEVDEMEQKNIPLAMERCSGQEQFWIWLISTPTIEAFGINLYFEQSSKKQFFFKCPSCSKHINLEFPRNLEITSDDPGSDDVLNSRLFCHECKATLNHADKPHFLKNGIWVPQEHGRTVEGFHINQLYSCASAPHRFAKNALEARSDPAAEQEFFNSKMGKPHAVEGARVTDKAFNACIGDYVSYNAAQAQKSRMITMGVDVGKLLHVEVSEWYWERFRGLDTNTMARCKVVFAGTFRHFEELDKMMHQWGVKYCVVDKHPETRKAREFAQRWHGKVRLCEYPVGMSGRNIIETEKEYTVKCDRTSWLDLSLGRFQSPNSIWVPQDIGHEYREHIKAQTRIYYKDGNGNLRAKYVKGSLADHYGHARNYCEIAFTLATVGAGNRAIGSPR